MRLITAIFAIISALFLINLTISTGCSPLDKQIVLHYNDDYQDPKSQNRTVWVFDLSKSKLTDPNKTLYAQMPSQYTWLGVSLDFTFFLTSANKMGTDDQFRRGYLTVGGTNIIPMSLSCTSPDGTCSNWGGSIHQLDSELYPKEYATRPVGVEIGFGSEEDVYSPKTGRNHKILAKLRLMCATDAITEYQKIPLNFVDNPQMSWDGDKLVLVFNYWTAAGCGVSRPAPPAPGPTPDFSKIIEFLVSLLKIGSIFSFIFCANVLLLVCCCLLGVCIPCCCLGGIILGFVAFLGGFMAKRGKAEAYEGHVQLGKDTGSEPVVQPTLPVENYY